MPGIVTDIFISFVHFSNIIHIFREVKKKKKTITLKGSDFPKVIPFLSGISEIGTYIFQIYSIWLPRPC